VNYFHHRFTPRVLVLLYHRVIDLSFDPQLLSVTPQHFDEHLEILHQFTQPMRLKDLASAIQTDKLPRRGVVITFDDGYIDNLQEAKPMLERYAIPATIFVTAGQLGSQDEFWWDELDRLLLQPGKLPETLYLRIHDGSHRWELNGATEYTEDDYMRYCGWHIDQSNDPTPRHKLYRSLYQLLHSMQQIERRRTIEKLQNWAGKDRWRRLSHRTLNADEVVLLAQGGLVEIGAHTMTHPMLATLPISLQREEISQSKACLEDLLDQPVDSFAYPHGSYTDETITLIREAGFKYACSSDTDAVWRGEDPFKMPRVVVRDWDGDEFARWLKGWLGI